MTAMSTDFHLMSSKCWNALLLVASLALLPACEAVLADQHEHPNQILDDGYQALFERRESIINDPSLPPLLVDGTTVQGCDGFIQLLRNGEAFDASATSKFYDNCLAASVLERSRPSQEERFPLSSIADDLYRNLDLRSLKSSLGPKVDDQQYTFEQLTDGVVDTSGQNLTIENPDWYYELKPIAIGDFNDDHVEDLFLVFTDQAKKGNYLSQKRLFLTRDKEGGSILSVSLPTIFDDAD